jgi:AraC-like DNA-binding protein
MESRNPVCRPGAGNDKSFSLRLTELTDDEIAYYGIRHIEGETVRKEIIITQEYVICHCEDDLTWEILAEVSNLSPGYLQKLYRKWCRLRLHDFQKLCRMEKAAEYLEDTTLSVKEICSAVGMKSTSYFSALFRQVYGLSPKEYRQIYGGCPKQYRQIFG